MVSKSSGWMKGSPSSRSTLTCSMLAPENAAQVESFLGRHAGWQVVTQRQFLPRDGGDGFFMACLTRTA